MSNSSSTNTTTASVAENTVKHWACFALAWAEERKQTPIHPVDLCNQMGDAFSEYSLRSALNELRKNGFAYRTPDGTRRFFTLTDEGKTVLTNTGLPTEFPGKGMSDETLTQDLSMPETVTDFEDLGSIVKWYQDDAASPTHVFYADDQTGDFRPLCGVSKQPNDPLKLSPTDCDDRDLCSCCSERQVFSTWLETEQNEDDATPKSTPSLFINDADLHFVASDKRHLWTLSANRKSRRPGQECYEPLCETVDSFSRYRTTQKISSLSPSELDNDDTCAVCEQHELVDEYREAVDSYQSSTEESESWWERYDEWLENRDFDDADSPNPERLLDEGLVPVSKAYTERSSNSRKLHAYQRILDADGEPKELFKTLCDTIQAGPEREDDIHGLDPQAFTRRGESCNRCAAIIENRDTISTSTGGAVNVDYDPFGVFGDEYSSESPLGVDESQTASDSTTAKTVDENGADVTDESADKSISESTDEIACPDCGSEFDTQRGLSLHWGSPKTECEYPVPDSEERAILTGIWLAGGDLDGASTPQLRKTSVNREALENINEQLDIWSGSVNTGHTSAEQVDNVEDGFDYEDANSQANYRLTTRACPWIERFESLSVAEVELTEVSARILYSFKGNLIDNSAIVFRHREGEALATLLEQAGFSVRSVNEPRRGKKQFRVQLTASASREFADFIEHPLPGFENKAFEFRDSHVHKESERATDSTGTKTEEETATDETQDKVPETISFEPKWEWVGVQLFKLGLRPLAIRAFKEDLSPAEVYGQGGIEDLIYTAARDSENNYNLDVGPPFPNALTIQEQPVDDDTVENVKRALGLSDNSNDSDGGNNHATA